MLNNGSIIKIGIYPNANGVPTEIEWIVLQTDNDKAKLMTRDVIVDYKRYHTEDGDAPWINSEIRKKLNNEVYNLIFSEKEKNCITESITVDDERIIKHFVWDEKYYEDYIGVKKCDPVMTRDYISIPSLHDLFNYILIPPDAAESSPKNEWRKIEIKDDLYKLDPERNLYYDEIYYQSMRVAPYPLLNSVFNGFESKYNNIYKRHFVIDSNGREFNGGLTLLMKLRLCMWIDLNKFAAIGEKKSKVSEIYKTSDLEKKVTEKFKTLTQRKEDIYRELANGKARIGQLDTAKADLLKRIEENAARKGLRSKADEDVENLLKQKRKIEIQLGGLGLFKLKEKKQLKDTIDRLDRNLAIAKAEANKQRDALNMDIAKVEKELTESIGSNVEQRKAQVDRNFFLEQTVEEIDLLLQASGEANI